MVFISYAEKKVCLSRSFGMNSFQVGHRSLFKHSKPRWCVTISWEEQVRKHLITITVGAVKRLIAALGCKYMIRGTYISLETWFTNWLTKIYAPHEIMCRLQYRTCTTASLEYRKQWPDFLVEGCLIRFEV